MKKGILIFLARAVFVMGISFPLEGGSNLYVCNYYLYDIGGVGQEGEYSLKAAFIYRFTQYVEWVNPPADKKFKIAVLGETPLTANLTEIAESAKVKDMEMEVEEYEDINEIKECQILFVSRNSSVPLRTILKKFGDKDTLIVTEQEGYGEEGSCINFFLSQNKIKFEVNMEAAERAGLTISSQLLQHAVVLGK